MFKVFSRIREILEKVLQLLELLDRIEGQGEHRRQEHEAMLRRMNELSERVATIEKVEDLIMRQNEQLLGRVIPAKIDLP